MKKSRILICSLAIGVLTIAAGTSLLMPSAAQAVNCFCPAAWSTLNQWGAGANCAAAIADFEANAQAQAEANCESLGREVCAMETPTHSACYFAEGYWRVDGQMRYKCLKCIPTCS
jgi:hypothetical protein